ncbi:hypothetical protein STBHUCCB_34820 [Salmonella enterica subsp. enterica serovar Typhi str. P-stx-12]|nr:hypothetical protein STBHUCCB_34820 [Salmonella enterica subsp. enterica serovar Typhi str. P-stx-12]AXR57839.1 hypothetical protein CJP42_4567 [Salmonella enterica subsp. enterica serovar Typhi]
MICQSLCGYLLPFSGKKQNIPSLHDCHPYLRTKIAVGECKVAHYNYFVAIGS